MRLEAFSRPVPRAKNFLALITGAAVGIALVLPAAPAEARPQNPYEERSSILIVDDGEFDADHGVRSGSGTVEDPYVISGWSLSRLEIRNTSAAVRIVDNNVRSQMILNWIGPNVTVQNNWVNDLRVNQNVRRTGDMTSGVISHNRFNVVGQLRHWDGIFEHNEVGVPNGNGRYDARAVNFDGFNGALFRNNLIYGYVEVRLHGHHHSSSFEDADDSHYHGTAPAHQHEGAPPAHDGMDHTERYHRVFVTDNEIHSSATSALVYTDTNHAGNDRTASSEQNPALNDPHVHYTRAYLWNNKLVGSGIYVQIFNAEDSRHKATATGLVDIRNNTIEMYRYSDFFTDLVGDYSAYRGIEVWSAQDVIVNIARNSVTAPPPGESLLGAPFADTRTIGLLLDDMDMANVFINNLSLTRFDVGIDARYLSESVYWYISKLKTKDVRIAVSYDPNTVRNKPDSQP